MAAYCVVRDANSDTLCSVSKKITAYITQCYGLMETQLKSLTSFVKRAIVYYKIVDGRYRYLDCSFFLRHDYGCLLLPLLPLHQALIVQVRALRGSVTSPAVMRVQSQCACAEQSGRQSQNAPHRRPCFCDIRIRLRQGFG